jgi:group I intron endonuclease
MVARSQTNPDANKKFVVYIATNKKNGHRYVGFTSVGLEKRQKAHVRRSKKDKSCPKFHNALAKYGSDCFDWQVAASFDTAKEALLGEVEMISKIKPEYNVSAGGEGTLGVPARNRRSVTCLDDGNRFDSMTNAAKFYNLDTTTIRDVCVGKYRSANGHYFILGTKLYSESERKELILKIEKISAQRRKRTKNNKSCNGAQSGKDILGRRATGPMKISRRVLCLDDGLYYPSASEAGRQYNIAKSAIIELCLGKNNRKTAGGLRFKYEDA